MQINFISLDIKNYEKPCNNVKIVHHLILKKENINKKITTFQVLLHYYNEIHSDPSLKLYLKGYFLEILLKLTSRYMLGVPGNKLTGLQLLIPSRWDQT